MECPLCGEINNGVIDSRPTKEGTAIRRRRRCLSCTGRFTTYESTAEQLLFLLLKRHAGRSTTIKGSGAVLSFMSDTFRGLSEEIEKLIVETVKLTVPEKVKKPRRKPADKVRLKMKAPAKKPVIRKAKKPRKTTDTAQVLNLIKRHKKGVDIRKLKKRTGFADSKIRAIIFRANKEGKIKRIGRGVYASA